MREMLFLCHRIPYPPDKGEKIRAWNFVRYLAQRRRVHLGCFIDDERDWAHRTALQEICAECCFVRLSPKIARLRSLRGLLNGSPLTLPYFYDSELDGWVRKILARPALDRVFVYCSAMAQYVPAEVRRAIRCVADLVDVDSEKWREYAGRASVLERWLLARESARLRLVEKDIAENFDATLISTAAEGRLLTNIVPAAAARVMAVPNGVDSDYFTPEGSYDRPLHIKGTSLMFAGAMDYRPNIEGAIYFAREVLPLVRQRLPDARFLIVGANPAPEVTALAAGENVVVTRRVADMRPYLAHASAVVVPLRIARGIQNKVLEAMAMAKPVIASSQSLAGIEAEIGKEALVADTPREFADAIERVVSHGAGDAIGQRARQRVIADYSWSKSLSLLDTVVDA